MRQLNSPAAPLLVRRWMKVPSNVAITTDIKAATAYRAYLLCVSVEKNKPLCLFTLWELGFFHLRMNWCTRHANVGTLWPCACISSTLTVWAQNSSTAKRRIWTPHLQKNRPKEWEKRKGNKNTFLSLAQTYGVYLHTGFLSKKINRHIHPCICIIPIL